VNRLAFFFISSFLKIVVLVSSEPRLQPIKETWLPIGFSDPALFYEILSHISQDITASFPGYAQEKQAFALHSQALRSVNRRLSNPVQSISNGIIATILGFACFSVCYSNVYRDCYANTMQHYRRDWATYELHMEGLRTIIRIRGGVRTLDHNRILRLLLSGYE
jgi:hypothetical protein